MRKVVLFFMFPLLILSIVLSLAGVKHITLGNQYYDFINYVTTTTGNINFNIPNIPKIPSIDNNEGSGIIELLNGILRFLNGLVALINLIITIVNMLIGALKFVIGLLVCLFTFNWSGSSIPTLSVSICASLI